MRRAFFFAFVLFPFISTLWAQSRYINLNVDNDLFFVTDYYYSSGIFVQYGAEIINEDEEKEQRKFKIWELGQEIYTPSDRFSTDVSTYDYPYGGWTYVKHSIQKEITTKKQFELGLQLGVTGDWSIARWMQNTYHTTVLNLPENAWVDQLPEAVHLNIFGQYFNQKPLGEYVYFMQQLYAHLGTQKIDAGGRFGFNLGTGNYFGLGANSLYNQADGDAFFLGINTRYIAHDYMLMGSLFNQDAPFTVENIPFRYEVELGFALQKARWKFHFMYKNRSPDNKRQPKKGHHLMNITLSHFFD